MTENDTRPKPAGPLSIGGVRIDPPLILAPMAGVTDSEYRSMMSRHGTGLVTTEMVSAQGLLRNQPGSRSIMRQETPLEGPLAVQIFGRDLDAMAEAARRVEAAGADIIDINAGCPVRKVVRQGAGAGLLKDPDQLARVVESVRHAVSIPVTVKIRSGWDQQSQHAVEVARRIEAAGADALTLHARTAVQHYSGRADWKWVRLVKAAVGIPVIGNGDVVSPGGAERALRESGCDGVMIARGSLGNPWLFGVIAEGRGRTVWTVRPGWDDLKRVAREHVTVMASRPRMAGHYRKILMWYSKNCPEGVNLRTQIGSIAEPWDMLAAFEAWVDRVAERGLDFLSTKVREEARPGGPTDDARDETDQLDADDAA